MTKTSDLTLTTSRTIAATPERVFDAWLDPATLKRFMRPAEGVTIPTAATDPKVGGRFDMVMQVGENALPHGGVYKVIDRPRCLVFSWESPHSVEGSEVRLDFVPADGGTHVTLTHVRFASVESRDNHAKGWDGIFSALDAVLVAA